MVGGWVAGWVGGPTVIIRLSQFDLTKFDWQLELSLAIHPTMGANKFWVQIDLGLKKLGPKIKLVHKNVCPNEIWTHIVFGQKNLDLQTFWFPKECSQLGQTS